MSEWYKTYYIVQTREDWYRLHLTENHFCLACGDDPDVMLRTIKRQIKTCRKVPKLMRAVERLDYGRPNDKTLAQYIKDYDTLPHVFEDEIAQAVRDTLEDIKFDTPFHRSMKRRRALTLDEDTQEQKTTTTEDYTTSPTIRKGLSLVRRKTPALT